MKVVCDTNVLVAGMVAEGLCRDIVKRRLVRVELITSQALLDELARTLRDKFHSEPGEVGMITQHVLTSSPPLHTSCVLSFALCACCAT